ncbi:UNVERIFIED_CONTAM: protein MICRORCHIDIA 2 [Sesamum latifolium]|uniref:Protein MICRORCHIDIA 2 n=1 Tax=Sesamum latifolium TaxID=2727402 RepID=A0AAW2X2N9_9LAMI
MGASINGFVRTVHECIDTYVTVETKIGFIKEAPGLGVCGFNVYHKNRLIRPYWKVTPDGSSKGLGVVVVKSTDRCMAREACRLLSGAGCKGALKEAQPFWASGQGREGGLRTAGGGVGWGVLKDVAGARVLVGTPIWDIGCSGGAEALGFQKMRGAHLSRFLFSV